MIKGLLKDVVEILVMILGVNKNYDFSVFEFFLKLKNICLIWGNKNK